MSAQRPDDPLLWLETIDGAEAAAWVEAQNAATSATLEDARFAADKQIFLDIMNAQDRIPAIEQRGDYLYNFWTDGTHPRGVWRRTTMDSFRTATPEWDVLFDVDALCAAEHESWVWGGCATLRPAHERGLIMLSRGGADAGIVREFDLVTRRFVEDGFTVPEAKTSVSWMDQDTVLIATPLGPDGATESGYARTIQRWRRGQPLADAKVLFEGKTSDLAVSVGRSTRMARTIITRSIDFWNQEVHVFPDGRPGFKLDIPTDAALGLSGEVLSLLLKSDWLGHPAGALLLIDFPAFLAGSRDFITLFEPAPRICLATWVTFDDHVILDVSNDLRTEISYAAAAEGWRPRVIRGLPHQGTVSVGRLGAEETLTDLVFWTTDYLTPTTMLLGKRDAEPEILKRGPERFDASGLTVARYDAVAKDGTLVPYFQIGRPDPVDAFVRMYGYGGFDVSTTPSYAPGLGKTWLEHGHVYVDTCLRGGGEFGPDWHKAGQREGKRVAQDDFAAIAADLVRRGVTTPARLCAEGGSNGGLLVGNMLTRHPALFGALVCRIPLLDMRRYTKLLAGASWIAEYGDPDKPEDWAFLKEISAYHLLAPDRPYPPIFFATTRRDDRVHPGHARKMAAAMHNLGYEAFFFEQAEGGHGSGADAAQTAAATARVLAFIRHALGIP